MANNRLYFVDTETSNYVSFARHDGIEWYVNNSHRETGRLLVDRLDELFEQTPYTQESKRFILISEDSEQNDVYDKYIVNGTEIR